MIAAVRGTSMPGAVKERRLVAYCDPPLRLSDPPRSRDGQFGFKDGALITGLYQDQYDDLEYLMRRYYAGLHGALDPLPSGVGRGTSYDKLGNKRHKPTSQPPPKSADLEEPDWTMARLAETVEALPFLHQQMLVWRILEGRSLAWCAEHEEKTERWASSTWGRLVTRLYFRARGLCD